MAALKALVPPAALVASLLLPDTPRLLATMLFNVALLFSRASAQALSAELVADLSHSITTRTDLIRNSKQVSSYSPANLAETPWVADEACPWMETTEIPATKGGGMLNIYYLPSSVQVTPYGLIVDVCDMPLDPPESAIFAIPYDYTSRYRIMLHCEGRGVMDFMADGKWRYRREHASLPVSYWNELWFSAICSRY